MWMIQALKKLLRMKAAYQQAVHWLYTMIGWHAPIWLLWIMIYARRWLFGNQFGVIQFEKEPKESTADIDLETDVQTLLRNIGENEMESRFVQFSVRDAKKHPRLFWQFLSYGFNYDILKDYFMMQSVPKQLVKLCGTLVQHPGHRATLEIDLLTNRYSWMLASSYELNEPPIKSIIQDILFKTVYYPLIFNTII